MRYRVVALALGLALCALLLVAPLARFLTTSAEWLDYPYPRPGSEGLILYESLLVKEGSHPYTPITPERLISGPYPPVYYWLAAATLPAQFPDWSEPEGVFSVFRPGRLISLLSALVIATLIPLIILFVGSPAWRGRRAGSLALAGGVLGGLLFLSLPQTLVWATRFRGDMLMLALTACGLACVAWWSVVSRQSSVVSRHHVSRITFHASLVLGAVCFALAFFTKQTALAGPLAAALFLLLRDRRVGLKWCVLMGLLVAVPFALLDLATGHWFYLKMVDYHSLPLSRLTLTRLLQFAFWDGQWPLILATLGYMAVMAREAWLRRLPPNRAPLLIPLFALLSFATLPTGAVVGADHNHLLMSGLAISLCTGALLARLLVGVAERQASRLATAALPLALLLVACHAIFVSAPSSWYSPDLRSPTPEEREQLRMIVHNIEQNPGALFFADDPGIVALAGKRTPYDDPFTMTALAPQGRWDEAHFRGMLRDGEFGLLALECDVTQTPDLCRADTLSPGVKDAIRAGYDVLFRDLFFTYAPKP